MNSSWSGVRTVTARPWVRARGWCATSRCYWRRGLAAAPGWRLLPAGRASSSPGHDRRCGARGGRHPFRCFALSRARARLREEQRRTGAKEAELQALLADSRERERLLNTILDTVDVGIVAVDAAGRRLLTNSWQSALGEVRGARDGAAQEHRRRPGSC